MLNWEYHAIDASGTRVKGRVRAEDKTTALKMVMAKKLSPLSVNQIKTQAGLFSGLSKSDVEQITTELALLLKNGVQLDRALEMMSESAAKPRVAAMAAEMMEDVRSGKPLHYAFSKFGQYFDNLFCEMVRIGEESGKLALTLERLASNLKFQNELSGRVSQAMIYPAFILGVCIIALFAIFNFIVPSMSGLFSNMKDIPAYTQFLISSSDWMQNNQVLLLTFIFLGVLSLISVWPKPWFKVLFRKFLTKLPLIKNGLLLNERIRFVSSMHLMLQSGLTLAQSLELAVNILADQRLASQLQRVKTEVSQGHMLSEALANTDIVEPVMLSLVKVGEESGRLDSVFGEISIRSRGKFEQWALKLTSLLEPLLIIIMGGLVGSVVVTMLLSIVSTSDVPL